MTNASADIRPWLTTLAGPYLDWDDYKLEIVVRPHDDVDPYNSCWGQLAVVVDDWSDDELVEAFYHIDALSATDANNPLRCIVKLKFKLMDNYLYKLGYEEHYRPISDESDTSDDGE